MPVLTDASAEQEAVTRLFDLARAGTVDNIEFNQLDSLVYSRLLENYSGNMDGPGHGDEPMS